MAAFFFTSEVISNQKLNYKFRLIQFKLKNSEPFQFKPGQFVVFKIGQSIYRSYSIASHPSKLPNWQILADITPGGPASTLIKNLKQGQEIQHSSARGVFFLKEKPSPYNIMTATGCGLASIIPMVEQLLQKNKKRVNLIWGLRYEKDICFLTWLKSFTDNSNFSYQIVLSKTSTSWSGPKGHLTALLLETIKKVPQKELSTYLCGSQSMINDVKAALEKINFSKNSIYFERYYSSD